MANGTETICMCSRIPEDVVIKFDGANISPSNHVKNMILYMDRYMSFETYVNEISKKSIGYVNLY